MSLNNVSVVPAKPAAVPAKPQAPLVQAPKQAPKPAATKPAKPFDDDFFKRKPVSKEQLAAAHKAIDDLKSMPSIPFSNAAKVGWIAAAKVKLAAAEAGAKTIGDAYFWDKSIPEAEDRAASDAVSNFGRKIEGAEVRAGLKADQGPLNPFRPTGQFIGDLTGSMPKKGFGGLLFALLLPVGVAIDVADIVTRPIQAIIWPFGWAAYGVRAAGRALGVG